MDAKKRIAELAAEDHLSTLVAGEDPPSSIAQGHCHVQSGMLDYACRETHEDFFRIRLTLLRAEIRYPNGRPHHWRADRLVPAPFGGYAETTKYEIGGRIALHWPELDEDFVGRGIVGRRGPGVGVNRRLFMAPRNPVRHIIYGMEPFEDYQSLKKRFQIVIAEATVWSATVYRAVGVEYANRKDLLSGEGTKKHGGRWTPGGFATVHASLDTHTAIMENLGTQQRYGIDVDARLPLTLVAIDVHLKTLLDLTKERLLRKLKMTRRKLLRCRWRETMEKVREPVTQAIGRAAFELGLEGFLAPSAQSRRGRNLIAFPENLQKGSSLSIQNVEKLPISRSR